MHVEINDNDGVSFSKGLRVAFLSNYTNVWAGYTVEHSSDNPYWWYTVLTAVFICFNINDLKNIFTFIEKKYQK